MKLLLILALSLSLSGCFWQTITDDEIEMGEKICQVKHGTRPTEFSADALGGEKVNCKEGNSYFIQPGNLK